MPHARPGPAAFRPEVEGLRAVAVLLVVADHLVGGPRGGFIGVDVFFVISGFLITGLLLREHERTGRISIKHFYQRRARRILPAGLAVLSLTAFCSWLIFLPSRARQVLGDAGWSTVFLANVHFASTGTDYFQADRPPSPVQHYWSLSVEEQFYLVWPLLLIVLLYLAGRSYRRVRGSLAVAVVLIVVGLFAISWRLTSGDRAAAYFLTPARAWELGVGAAVAVVMRRRRMPSIGAKVLLPMGLIAIILGSTVVREGPGFPAPDAALPVLGAAAIIVAGSATRLPVTAAVLTNPVSRYIGRVSYSLYLVHFPVIIILEAVIITRSASFYGTCIFLMIGATVACHELVERPLRALDYRALFRTLRSRPPRRRTDRQSSRLVPVGIAAAVVGALVCWSLQPYSPVHVFAQPAAAAVPTTTELPFGLLTPPKEISKEIIAALNMHTMPGLDPPQAELAEDKVPEWGACGNVGPQTESQCTFASKRSQQHSKTIAVIGDSIAVSWLPAIRTLQQKGYTIHALTYGQCPAADVGVKAQVGTPTNFTQVCNQHRAWALNEVDSIKPNIVVLANSYSTVERLESGRRGDAAVAEWKEGTQKTVSRLRRSHVKRIVLLSSPPQGSSMQACTPSDGDPSHCIATISGEWRQVANAERQVMKSTHQTYIDSHLLFCSADGFCPPFIGTNTPLVDGIHLADNYVRRIAPIIAPLIVETPRR